MAFTNRTVGFLILILFLFSPLKVYAMSISIPPEETGNHFKKGNFYIELPLYDYPFNTENSGSFPSMQQSLAITKDLYQVAHAGIESRLSSREKILARFSITALDFLLLYPILNVWQHEEWHRAVLSRRSISSYDDVYKFDLTADSISVSRVKDEDLIRLKRESPADMVRLAEAGIEGEYELVTAIQKDNFFYGINTWNLPLYLFTYMNNINYVYFSGTNDAGAETDRINLEEGADIPKRDALGFDFTAWVYDLFRPTEPYEARGVHPSGTGIDRYIKPSDLTSEELRYLRRQGRLAFLNLLDPHLLGISRFRIINGRSSPPIDVNMSIRHHLTSFGYTIDTNIFFKKDDLNLFMVVHNYANRERHFPGLDIEMLRYPVTISHVPISLNVRSALWLQPEEQMFKTEEAKFGGLASLRVGWSRFSNVEPSVEVTAKTAGWVAGNPYLDSNTSVQTGLVYRFK